MKKLIVLLVFGLLMAAGEVKQAYAQSAGVNLLNLWDRQTLGVADTAVNFNLQWRYTVNYLIAEDIDLDSNAVFKVYNVIEGDSILISGRPQDYTQPDVTSFTVESGDTGDNAKSWLLLDALIGRLVIVYEGGTGSWTARVRSANLLK